MTPQVLAALSPVVLLIVLGFVLRRHGFLDEGFWRQAERLSYFVLLPSLFFHGLVTADIGTLPVAALTVTLVAAILAVAALALVLRPMIGLDGPGFTSVFQGSIRFNNYVGVTLAVGLFPESGIALAAICNAVIVPTVNILCVLVFARHGQARLGLSGVLRQVATNPLVLASLSGIAAKSAGFEMPPGLGPALRSLGAASLPLGLLCVGAALHFGGARRWVGPVATASALKFGAMPLATLAVALPVGLSGEALLTALVFQSLPTASSSYILARQLGGDAPLMAGITAAQTVLAVAAIPLVLTGLMALAGI